MQNHSQTFPDQSHMNRVRDALSISPTSRASVMVGSGFSRNAEKVNSNANDIPLWQDIATEIFNTLYPDERTDGRDGESVGALSADNALRLAQEYETAFGQSELYRLLGQLVRNDDFTPGKMHERLLRLPWRDVFTTNWDTLLERAAFDVGEPKYTLVQNIKQLPIVTQPRIIKLHGSFPSEFPLISTEEDYRTYPIKFAPFVNTVQQAMMETVFLLIGFSGDDPNFLKWSGWVRDNLGKAAPRLYLAGWLNLSRHRRSMLEHRGVIAIDLANHPKASTWPRHRQHQYAAEWLLLTLEPSGLYDETTWPSPPAQEQTPVPDYLEPVGRVIPDVPKKELDVR